MSNRIPKRDVPAAPEPEYWPLCADEESYALGALILGQAAEGLAVLKPEHFGLDANRDIFLAIRSVFERGEDPHGFLEIPLLAAELRRRNQLDGVGGIARLADLTDGVCLGRKWESRLRPLQEMASRRKYVRASIELKQRALDLTRAPQETAEWLMTVAR